MKLMDRLIAGAMAGGLLLTLLFTALLRGGGGNEVAQLGGNTSAATSSDGPSICLTKCGDSIIAGPETCDDGNTKNGDGCSDICKVEPGFLCIP